MKQENWHGCYEDGWQGEIVPEAFAHPAKMAYGLLQRIYDHAFGQGWLKEGDVVVDPFGGIGSTGILGAYKGVQVVCVELEAKFTGLAMHNMFLHLPKWRALGVPVPVIIQGDSRRLCELVGGADCVVGSPPFAVRQPPSQIDFDKLSKTPVDTYGTTPGQLGSMKAGSVEAVISSPPYAESLQAKEDVHKTQVERLKRLGNVEAANKLTQKADYQAYNHTPGNLGNLKPGSVKAVISSPPYAETLTGDGTQAETAAESRAKRQTEGGSLGQSQRTQGYGSEGNLGNLKPGSVDAVLSSPPYEGCQLNKVDTNPERMMGGPCAVTSHGGGKVIYDHQGSANNVGSMTGPTFWAAAKEIVQQCHQILKQGGHAIWVVKDFVRKGQKVDFTGDWRRLCESIGFETVCVHHAMLVKETKMMGLFGHTHTQRTERKSFFRRLAEAKGCPPINYEVVLCMQKRQ